MEDDLNNWIFSATTGQIRGPNQNRGRLKSKTTSMEEDLNGRQPPWKMTRKLKTEFSWKQLVRSSQNFKFMLRGTNQSIQKP
jgi:hypothetical protein